MDVRVNCLNFSIALSTAVFIFWHSAKPELDTYFLSADLHRYRHGWRGVGIVEALVNMHFVVREGRISTWIVIWDMNFLDGIPICPGLHRREDNSN